MTFMLLYSAPGGNGDVVDIAGSGLSKKLDLKAGFGWMLLFTCILMWFYVAFYGMRCEVFFVVGGFFYFRLSFIK